MPLENIRYIIPPHARIGLQSGRMTVYDESISKYVGFGQLISFCAFLCRCSSKTMAPLLYWRALIVALALGLVEALVIRPLARPASGVYKAPLRMPAFRGEAQTFPANGLRLRAGAGAGDSTGSQV